MFNFVLAIDIHFSYPLGFGWNKVYVFWRDFFSCADKQVAIGTPQAFLWRPDGHLFGATKKVTRVAQQFCAHHPRGTYRV